jgi:hypothetical protein
MAVTAARPDGACETAAGSAVGDADDAGAGDAAVANEASSSSSLSGGGRIFLLIIMQDHRDAAARGSYILYIE